MIHDFVPWILTFGALRVVDRGSRKK